MIGGPVLMTLVDFFDEMTLATHTHQPVIYLLPLETYEFNYEP